MESRRLFLERCSGTSDESLTDFDRRHRPCGRWKRRLTAKAGRSQLASSFRAAALRRHGMRNRLENGRRLAVDLSHHPGELDGVVVVPAQTGQLFIGRPLRNELERLVVRSRSASGDLLRSQEKGARQIFIATPRSLRSATSFRAPVNCSACQPAARAPSTFSIRSSVKKTSSGATPARAAASS